MSSGRCLDKVATLFRRLTRLAGAPEVSQRRIGKFLEEAGGRALSIQATVPSSLAIVVPCYGHAPHLAAMFTSIIRQTRLPDEVIFVDDRSPDNTGEILGSLIADQERPGMKRFTLLANERNMGQSASLNRGIGAAKSELIMILNDDDYLMHDAVEIMMTLFVCYRQVALIGGHSIHFTGDGEPTDIPRTGTAYAGAADVRLVVHQPAEVRGYRHYNDLNMTHSGSCFLKSAWEVVGGYYPDKKKRVVPFSDRDFQLRVNALFPVAVSPDVPFSFWRHDSSVDQGLNS